MILQFQKILIINVYQSVGKLSDWSKQNCTKYTYSSICDNMQRCICIWQSNRITKNIFICIEVCLSSNISGFLLDICTL